MKKELLLVLLTLSIYQIFPQDLVLPLKRESFGLNHQTNRDISYFSHVDELKNTIIIGTTERDSSFTDILTTKIDENYNLLWQKRVSINTDLSYDIPLKSFINSNNEVYVIGRSSTNQSFHNGILFIEKYSENGNIIYNKTIGNTDGSDYTDFRYFNADLNSDGTLSLVYVKDETNDFNFLKINNQGEVINSFTHEIVFDAIIGEIKNEVFYFLASEINDDYTYNYKFHKVVDVSTYSSLEIVDTEFNNYYLNNVVLSEQVVLNVDTNENCHIIGQITTNNETKERVNISKVDTNNNTFVYSLTTSDTDNYSFINSFINEQNENIAIVNNIINNSIDYIKVDEYNNLQIEIWRDNLLATGFKKNDDGSFFLTTSNSNIRLFSNNLNELRLFNTSDLFELKDFSKIDDASISVIGTSYDKMFPESDYYTQLNIEVEKINETQILNNYTYSGIGTSRAFQQRLIIDGNNNYIVLVTEKMGPEYLGIGGVDPPLNKRIIKYDSNLNKLWESEVPEHIFNLVNHGGRDIDYFLDSDNNLYLNLPRAGDYYGLGYDLYKVTTNGVFEFINSTYVGDKFHANDTSIFIALDYFLYDDSSKLYILNKTDGNLIDEIEVGHEEFIDIFTIGNDYYFYTYEEISNNNPDVIYLYKNGVKVFTRNLTNNYGIFPFSIDDEGTLFFATDYASNKRINKLDINNSYSYYSTADEVKTFKKFNNGNIFLFLDNNDTLILDENLNFIGNGESINSETPYLSTFGNYILLGTFYENSIRVIDQNGAVIRYFKVQGFLHEWYSKLDKQNNLIMVGEFGDRIYTANEYSWFRGFIHNYGTIDDLMSIDELDNDQISEVIIYPNPTSNMLNIKLKQQNFEKVILYDIAGKLLNEFKTNTIDLSAFKSGMYLIKIFTKSNEIINSKVIKN
jgi:hypothetical protein